MMIAPDVVTIDTELKKPQSYLRQSSKSKAHQKL